MLKIKFHKLILITAMLVSGVIAEGVYGLNKVQYRRYDWQQVQTAHFDIYFYEPGEYIASFAAREIENLYEEVAELMNHKLSQRIPIIIHNTHAQFSETNVLRYPIPDAVGGFTEIFKNRVVLPFDGNYQSFRHVLQHEMIHAMTFDLVSHGRKGYSTAAKLGDTPLWAMEGIAEYGSLGWEIGGEVAMLDAVSSGYLRNPAYGLWGFMAYKGGQNFLHFIESNWGTGTVARLFHSISRGLSFEVAFLRSTRVSLQEAGDIWLRELRRIYWPELGQRQHAKIIARAMTDHRQDESFYNVQPAISPDGKFIAFFSDRGNREAIYLLDVNTEKIVTAALEGGHVAAHESFNSFTSALSWSPDSRHLALVSKQAGSHVINVLDTRRTKVISTIMVEGLDAMASPAISPTGDFMVVSGQQNGKMNLYKISLPSKIGAEDLAAQISLIPQALTADDFTQEHPKISPSGKLVAFQSNQNADFNDKMAGQKSDIFVLDLATKSKRKITESRWSSETPAWGENDSLLYFVSNRSGIDNIYAQEVYGDSLWAITNILAGVATPTLSSDGKFLSFSLFENGGWDVFLLRNPLDKKMSADLPKTHFIKFAEDSSKEKNFFNPVIWENLKSWRDSLAMDSLEQRIRYYAPEVDESDDSERVTTPVPPESGDFFIDDAPALPVPPTPAPKKKAVKDSVKAVEKDPAINKYGVDTTKVFLSGKDAIPFDEEENLVFKPYQTKWSLDQAMAVAGFSSNDGVGGEGAITISDLVGDQEINMWFFGGGRLDNINFFLQYGYLPQRLDVFGTIFHNYREGYEDMSYYKFLELRDSISTDPSDKKIYGLAPYGDRSFGASLDFMWPFSIYSRLDFGSSLTWRTRSWYDINTSSNANIITGDWTKDPDAMPENANSLELRASWSFDNAEWGSTGPILGERLWVGGTVLTPKILQDKYAFWRLDMDFRKYFRVFKRYTFAWRVAGGISEAMSGYANPHRYLLGGDSWTINWHFNENNWRGTQENVFFDTWEAPLRGFKYHDFAGTRMALTNLEFRFPFIDYLALGWPIPLTIGNVMGVGFLDYGGTWDNRNFMENRGMGFGAGLRLNLGMFVLRYTKSWAVKEMSSVPYSEYTYWSLGAEF